jgi:hypothetical protein
VPLTSERCRYRTLRCTAGHLCQTELPPPVPRHFRRNSNVGDAMAERFGDSYSLLNNQALDLREARAHVAARRSKTSASSGKRLCRFGRRFASVLCEQTPDPSDLDSDVNREELREKTKSPSERPAIRHRMLNPRKNYHAQCIYGGMFLEHPEKIAGTKSRYRYGNILQSFLPLLRRDDNF